MRASKHIEIIVETPKGSAAKFDFDSETTSYKLKKILPAGMVFPFDFGFIPGTEGEDGDPLDVMVLAEEATFTGCRVRCRIIGCLRALQTERHAKKPVRNDRFIAVSTASNVFGKINDLKDLPANTLRQIEQFFENYNAEAGKKFLPEGHVRAAEAAQMIADAKLQRTAATYLVRFLLPLYDNNKQSFPKAMYTRVKAALTKKFGGVTVFSQAPAEGLWAADEQNVIRDKMLVFEVVVDDIDRKYWARFKAQIKKQFRQQEQLIYVSSIGCL